MQISHDSQLCLTVSSAPDCFFFLCPSGINSHGLLFCVRLMFTQKIFLFNLLNQKKKGQQCVFARTGLLPINHLQFRKLRNWFGQKDSLSRCCFNAMLALSWVRRRRSVVTDSSLATGDGCCQRKCFYTQSGIDRVSRSELKTPLLLTECECVCVWGGGYAAQWHKFLTAAAAQHNSTVQPEAAALITPPAPPKQVSSF